MRRLITFACEGETLVGTVDEADGATGLLMVSGGNEVRTGAHRGLALLAGRLSAGGIPVFRFDRRGVGDSGGENAGYLSSHADIIAAGMAFRQKVPHLDRVIGFGNCDGATALALFGHDAGLNGVILANPWVVEREDDLPPAAAIRARYLQRLRDPAAWRALATGGIDFSSLLKGLRRIVATPSQPRSLAANAVAAIETWGEAAHVVLAERDSTAIAYADAARRLASRAPTTLIDTASHSFARQDDDEALERAIWATLASQPTT